LVKGVGLVSDSGNEKGTGVLVPAMRQLIKKTTLLGVYWVVRLILATFFGFLLLPESASKTSMTYTNYI